MATFLLIVGLILFVGLVVVHEFGHFIMARRGGVEVEEFGIGFPPALYKRQIRSRRGSYRFSLNLLPLGGFVKLKGEHDSDTEPGSYGAASLKVKTQIMVAGVAMNLLVAFVLLTIVAWVGMPQLVNNQFTVRSDTNVISQADTKVILSGISNDSPAARAGLKANDQITAVGPAGAVQPLINSASLQNITAMYAGRTVIIKYLRNGQAAQTTAKLNTRAVVDASQKTSQPTGYLGVTLNEATSGLTLQRSTWSAPVVAAGLIGQFTVLTFQGLGHALAGLGSMVSGAVTGNHAVREAGQTAASSQVSGPVGIFVILKAGSAQGYQLMLFIIAIISLSLAIMNILPIPALDGGRLWLTLGARALHRNLTQRAEELINSVGFVLLLGLIIVITVVDVRRFF